MDLCLDLSLASAPSLFLGDVSRRSRDMSEKLAMLENYVQRLEDEMNKVEAFKRELPLCMLLVKEGTVLLILSNQLFFNLILLFDLMILLVMQP